MACAAAFAGNAPSASTPSLIYKQNCASCHDAPGNSRIPSVSSLRQMSAEAVLHSLEQGAMKPQAQELTTQQRRALAEYISGKRFQDRSVASGVATGKCSSQNERTAPANNASWNGWGMDLSNTRFQPESGGLAISDVPKLKLRWAFAFPHQSLMMAQPAVMGSRIYIGSADGKIYSLDAGTGCIDWSAQADSGVRAAPTVISGKKLVVFADLAANVYAFDTGNGKLVWRTKVEEFPGARISGSPQVHENIVYVPVASVEENTSFDVKYECCRFRGSVVALDLNTGQQIWKTYTIPDPAVRTRMSAKGTQLWGPSGVGVWAPPTLDPSHNLLYVGTGNNYSDPFTSASDAILALDMKTGNLVWTRQITGKDTYNGGCYTPGKESCPERMGPDFDFGSPPILVSLPAGKRLLIASQKSAVVTALDPDHNGEIVWQTTIGEGGPLGGIEWGSSADAEHVYVPLSDTHPLFKKDNDPDLDPSKGGGVFALDLATGKIAWHAVPPAGCKGLPHCGPANSAPTTVIPGVVFAGSVDGHIRAYSAHNGSILWDYNTAHGYHAVNQADGAQGGSIDSAGPVVAGKMVFVVSGYPLWGGRPGNVLLAFSP